LQLPAPSHELLPVHAFAGTVSSVYLAMLTQVPPLPVQAVHVAQLAAQQWPSVQAVVHWLAAVHAAPLASLQSMSCPVAQLPAHGVQAEGQKPSDVPLHARADDWHSNVQLETVPVRVRTVFASPTQASYCVLQADDGSHFSAASTTELPHTGVQLLSLLALQAEGQQPSPLAQAVCMPAATHWAVQAAAVPCSVRSWQPTGGQLAGQLLPSQVSAQAGSVTPLPQRQQPSPFAQVVITTSFTHSALHWAAVPCRRRVWQPIAGQLVGQLPSHFSPVSTTPLPQRGAQSLSLLALQPVGQQPSAKAHVVCVPSSTQAAVQAAALPASRFLAQPTHGQEVGQLEGGSQVSPLSTAPLPQRATQSPSLVALQPAGQQPSAAARQAVCSTSFTHWA
jgi:hypothetical protein